jgi:hypothetical protein
MWLIYIGEDCSICPACAVNDLILPSEDITVYPNPSSSLITIGTSGISSKFQVSIFNLSGKQLVKHQITEQQTVVDVSGLSQGVYFVKVADDRTVRVGKVVKQ